MASRFGSGTRRVSVPPPPVRDEATVEETTKPFWASARFETWRATPSICAGRTPSVIAAERSIRRLSRPSEAGEPSPWPGGTTNVGSAGADWPAADSSCAERDALSSLEVAESAAAGADAADSLPPPDSLCAIDAPPPAPVSPSSSSLPPP